MAQQMLSFIHSRAPRAAGVSDEAIDEHKELIRDLYLTQNYTRDRVIAHLKTELDFNLSPDQFSKAIKRWGFRKQVHGNRSTQQPSKETAMQFTATDTTSNQLPCTANEDDLMRQLLLLTNNSSKHSIGTANSTSCRSNTMALGPSPLSCPPVKRPRLTNDPGDIAAQSLLHMQVDADVEDDGDMTMGSATEEQNSEPVSPYLAMYDAQSLAEYLACCRHPEAFSYYHSTLVSSNNKRFSTKQRRAKMLDMARVAKTQRDREIVRAMLEAELEMSNDPLAEEGHAQSQPETAKMCRIQLFLFHRYLAQIYACQNDGAISMQKHLDSAKNFTKYFNTHGPLSMDLWSLLSLVQEKKDTGIPGDLVGSLQWDFESYDLNIEHCCFLCWETLNPTKPMNEAMREYGAGRRTRTAPVEMSDLASQNRSDYLWKRSFILFTFLWRKIQRAHGPLPWTSGHPTISPAHILMIVSRIIVKRSCLISKHNDDLLDQEEQLLTFQPKSLQLYCDALLGFRHDTLFETDGIKREFATQFVEHHSWSPPLASEDTLATQSQDYPIEALKTVLAVRTVDSLDYLFTPLEELTTSFEKASENQPEPTDSDLSRWLEEHQGQTIFTHLKNASPYVYFICRRPPTKDSSGLPTSTSSRKYLVALKGNPTISRPLASHPSSSSQRSYSSSLQRFKAAALSRQHQPNPTLALSENNDVLMDEDLLEDPREDEFLDDWMVV